MKTQRPEEHWESSYLQSKLPKITEDEVLDFYLAMSLAPTVGSFIAHYEHDCAVGQTSATPPAGEKCNPPLLFHCASCQRDFIEKYPMEKDFGQPDKLIKPECPDCGRNLFVDEAKD